MMSGLGASLQDDFGKALGGSALLDVNGKREGVLFVVDGGGQKDEVPLAF
jgi:hypothetical protein